MRRARGTSLLLRSLGVPFLAVAALVCLDGGAALALDAASARCVECHETFMDPDVPGVVCHEQGCDHAIGVDYAGARARLPALTPEGELPPEVGLPGGAIGCTTCHVPYSEADHEALAAGRAGGEGPDPMLVIDNAGSALCLVCHRM